MTIKSFIFSLFLLFSSYGFINAKVTINGKDIASLMQADRTVIFFPSEATEGINIGFPSAQPYNIIIDPWSFKDHSKAQTQLESLGNLTHKPAWSSKKITMNAKALSFTNQCLHGPEEINLKASETINCSSVAFQSLSGIVLGAGKSMRLEDCLCDAPSLELQAMDDTSWYKSIRFTFKKESSVPSTVTGLINFETNEILFMVLGVSEVRIQFSENASK